MKTPVRFRHQKNRYRHSESFKYLLASFARICDLDFVSWCQNTACSPVRMTPAIIRLSSCSITPAPAASSIIRWISSSLIEVAPE